MSFPAGMLVTNDVGEARRAIASARKEGARIGSVPTMGALHAGHVSLMQRARREAGFVAVSIFVNPKQFGPQEDLSRYPRPLEADLKACRDAGADLVFVPEAGEIYPGGFSTYVDVEGLSAILEGASRPGHFRGVATVVLKLLNILQPDVAFFGQKDYQQQALIRRMVRDLNVPVEIIVCPTVREPDGLALSSRNTYLSREERRSALALFQSLQVAEKRLRGGDRDLPSICEAMRLVMASTPHVAPEYAVIADLETLTVLSEPEPRMVILIAARVGSTRLIDNAIVELTAEGTLTQPASSDVRSGARGQAN
jgi:pantoate--beta-alanine ligase